LLFTIALSIFFIAVGIAQQEDATSVSVDSSALPTVVDSSVHTTFWYRTFQADYPNPKKAALLAIIPGMGQAYNKKWWKIPIVYGAFTGVIIAVDFNKRNYDTFQTAYLAALNNETHQFSGTSLDNVTSLRTIRNGYDKNLQLSYIVGVLVYLLQGVDAFVDAHLLDFDVSEDLSLRLDPTFILTPQQSTPGVGLSLQF
ncbi:MAG: DUF5683 domain-containing protein, partial [Bacteroidota bacterium]